MPAVTMISMNLPDAGVLARLVLILSICVAGGLTACKPKAGPPAPAAPAASTQIPPGGGWIAFRFVDAVSRRPVQPRAMIAAPPGSLPDAYAMLGWRKALSAGMEKDGVYRIEGIPDVLKEVSLTWAPSPPPGQSQKRYAIGKEHEVALEIDDKPRTLQQGPGRLFSEKSTVEIPRPAMPVLPPADPNAPRIPIDEPAGKGWIAFRFYQGSLDAARFAEFGIFANRPDFLVGGGYTTEGWAALRSAFSAKDGVYRIEGIPDRVKQVYMIWEYSPPQTPQVGPYVVGQEYSIALPEGAGRPWPKGKYRATFQFIDTATSRPMTDVVFSVYTKPFATGTSPRMNRAILFDTLRPSDAKDGRFEIDGLDVPAVYVEADTAMFWPLSPKAYDAGVEQTVVLRRQGWLHGRAVDSETGKIVNDYTASTATGGELSKYTDGSFGIRIKEAVGTTATLTVDAPEHQALRKEVRVESSVGFRDSIEPEYRLRPSKWKSLRILVADGLTGKLLHGARVFLIKEDHPDDIVLSPAQFDDYRIGDATTTDAGGETTVRDEDGKPHSLFVTAPGHAPLLIPPDQRPAPDATGAVILDLGPESAISGTLFIEGKPAAYRKLVFSGIRTKGEKGKRYRVSLVPNERRIATDADGHFEIDQLTAGGYRLQTADADGGYDFYLCDSCGNDRGDLAEGEHAVIQIGVPAPSRSLLQKLF